MRALLSGALLGVLALVFGHTAAPLAAPALAHAAVQPLVLVIAASALARPILTRRVPS